MPGGGFEVSDTEADAVLQEASGDPPEAIRMLPEDLSMMALGRCGASGFLLGRFSEGCRMASLDR